MSQKGSFYRFFAPICLKFFAFISLAVEKFLQRRRELLSHPIIRIADTLGRARCCSLDGRACDIDPNRRREPTESPYNFVGAVVMESRRGRRRRMAGETR